jgi:L-aminopeptidase/D-esterase-like protein
MSGARAGKAPSLARFGLAVGHATDAAGATGCTVVRGASAPHRAAVAVLGRATGSRELALLAPGHLVERVDAILLTGGSAYGLDAAAGVMRWMESKQRGFNVGAGVVPIVPAAVLFDLLPHGRFDARPTPEMAFSACDAATSENISEGLVGAGTGLTVGKLRGPAGAMRGGFGIAVAEGNGLAAAAIVAVNAFGDIRDAQGRIIAGARDEKGAFVDTARAIAAGTAQGGFAAAQNTTLAIIAVDAAFTRVELERIAHSAAAAYHKRITPAGTAADGDIVFALAPMEGPRACRSLASAAAAAAWLPLACLSNGSAACVTTVRAVFVSGSVKLAVSVPMATTASSCFANRWIVNVPVSGDATSGFASGLTVPLTGTARLPALLLCCSARSSGRLCASVAVTGVIANAAARARRSSVPFFVVFINR